MAIPLQSLSGTEVLRRGGVKELSNNWTSIKWDNTFGAQNEQGHTVPTNHIIIVTSVTFCEQGNANEYVHMWVNTNSQDHHIFHTQAINAYSTFIWADKFVLVGGDKLAVVATTSANIDVWVNYIDQSWV